MASVSGTKGLGGAGSAADGCDADGCAGSDGFRGNRYGTAADGGERNPDGGSPGVHGNDRSGLDVGAYGIDSDYRETSLNADHCARHIGRACGGGAWGVARGAP